ncbi:MAG: hypothetical protein ABIG92_01035 [Candidatus Omnitrophota bacterium]
MEYLKRLFKNEVTKNVIIFFNENPHSIDTAKGISIWIGHEPEEVEDSLKILLKNGILINHKTVSTTAYSYTNNRKITKTIEEYIKKNINP